MNGLLISLLLTTFMLLSAATTSASDRKAGCANTSQCGHDHTASFSEAMECCLPTTDVKRPITQTYMLKIGGTSALDTYLSPVRYNGWSVDLAGSWSKRLPWHRNSWQMAFDADAGVSRMLNPAGNAMMLGFDGSVAWGVARIFLTSAGISFTVGASTLAECGVLYLPRNSNNPASAKAAVSIAATASISYPFKIGRLPVRLSNRVSFPSLSLFFSPHYGETYYEIYLGNHSGLAHFGWWGNKFCIDNLLSFDLDIGPSSLRIGYGYSLRSSWVNELNTQLQTHSFVVGWIPHGIGLRHNSPSSKALSIYSL